MFRDDLAMVSVTVSRRDSIVERLQGENDRLSEEVSCFTSEVGSFKTPHNELEVFRRLLVYSNVEIDRLRAVPMSACNSRNGDLAVLDDQLCLALVDLRGGKRRN